MLVVDRQEAPSRHIEHSRHRTGTLLDRHSPHLVEQSDGGGDGDGEGDADAHARSFLFRFVIDIS